MIIVHWLALLADLYTWNVSYRFPTRRINASMNIARKNVNRTRKFARVRSSYIRIESQLDYHRIQKFDTNSKGMKGFSLFLFNFLLLYLEAKKSRTTPPINLSQIYRSIDDDLNNPDDSKKFQKSFPFLSSKVTPYLPSDNSIYEKKGAVNATSPQWFRYRATW